MTGHPPFSLRPNRGFNPHTYMRCDQVRPRLLWFRDVSIHTPTWGVTALRRSDVEAVKFQSTHLHEVWPSSLDISEVVNTFQSTHLHEVWQISRGLANYLDMFQSTHLHEVWRRMEYDWYVYACFNPHTYMRCDLLPVLLLPVPVCFNPHTYMRCDIFPPFA